MFTSCHCKRRVELKVKGHKKDILMDPASRVVQMGEQVALSILLPFVKTEIAKQIGKGRIIMIESVTKDNSMVAYEAHIKIAGKVSEVKVNLNGKPIPQ
jgi:hypothetical protein